MTRAVLRKFAQKLWLSYKIVFFCDTHATEIVNSTMLFLWGLLLLFSPTKLFSELYLYNVMESIASEFIWGVIAIVLSLSRYIALLINHRRQTRKILSVFSFVYWSVAAWSLILVNPWTTASAIYPVLAFSDAWTYVRLKLAQIGSGY